MEGVYLFTCYLQQVKTKGNDVFRVVEKAFGKLTYSTSVHLATVL
jgi:hypothetical protein